MSAQMTNTGPGDQLRTISRALQDLHRTLLDYQRREYERFVGRIASDFYLLTLAAEDPQFAWIRPLSAEMMRIDVLLASKDGLDPVEFRLAGTRLRYLLTPTTGGNSFQSHYERAMPTNPEIIMAHATAMRSLPPAPAVTLFRDDPPADIRTTEDVPGLEERVHHPGTMVPGHGDHGYRALAAISEIIMAPGTTIQERAYANEDVLWWMPDGHVRLDDPDGRSLVVDPEHLLVVNAGTGIRLALSAPPSEPPLRMLHVLFRPSKVGGEPRVQHGAIPDAAPDAWRALVAPEGSAVPFHVRNNIEVYDAVLHAGQSAALPSRDGWDTCFFVFDGSIEIDGVPFTSSQSGLAINPDEARVIARESSRVLAFLIDPAAKVTRAGTTAR